MKYSKDKRFLMAMIDRDISDLLKKAGSVRNSILLNDFIQKIKTDVCIKRFKQCLYVSACLFVFACILHTGLFDKLMSWSLRTSSIKLALKLDWMKYRNQKCYIPNPMKRVQQFDLEDCEQCETINSVMFIDDTDDSDFMKVVKQDIPVAMQNTVSDKARVFDSVTEFADLFLTIDELALYEPCGFASNLKRKVDDHRHLIQLVASNDITSFYTHWENCADISFKSFRQFYERPKLLPLNVQLTDSNWVMLCSNYDGKTQKEIDITAPLFVLMVMKGEVEIKISPNTICEGQCSEIREILSEDTVLLLTDTLWSLKYTPSCKTNETILVGINGYFD